MAKDKELHHRELLITLDYLLNHTDEFHPATTEAICKFANEKYDLHYNGAGKSMEGNEIDRRRVGELLHFIDDFCNKYELPFVLQQTSGGKYYVEQKNYLNEEQIAKILAAVVNDRYTHDEDTEFLVNRLLEVLSTSEHNRKFLEDNYKRLLSNTKKLSISVNRKLKALKKALDEKRAICLVHTRFGKIDKENVLDAFHSGNKNKRIFLRQIEERLYCRVYRIEEHNNKPYAILIPIIHKGVIFDAVDNLPIAIGLPDRELFNEDEEREDRLEQLFKMNNSALYRLYGSLDEYINKHIIPDRGFAFKTSFYFRYKYLESVKNSFEEFFGIDLPVIPCRSFSIDENVAKKAIAIETPFKTDKYAIKCLPLKEGEEPTTAVVNITINRNAFLVWLESNPNIAEAITVVAPESLNAELAFYHLDMLIKYKNHLDKDVIYNALETGRITHLDTRKDEKENKK